MNLNFFYCPVFSEEGMARNGRRHQSVVQRNYDSLKAYFGVSPMPAHKRTAQPPVYIGAYSRRGTLNSYHISGAPQEQVVFETMRTYSPATCTKTVAELYLEVASLVSVYYDTLDYLHSLELQS